MADSWFWVVLLAVLGLVFGSFIATAAIRCPAGRSPFKGRSECDGCGKTLRPGELVPVLTFVALRGRCAACGAPIAPSHLVTELLGCAIGVLSALAAPGEAGVALAVCGWLLLALGAFDLAAFWLPNVLTGALALSGVGAGLVGVAPSNEVRLVGLGAGFVSLWLVAFLYRRLRGRDGLGGGDPKLFGAIGAWVGWEGLPQVLLAASLLGLLTVVLLRLGGRRLAMQDRLPLGVFLAAAAWPLLCLSVWGVRI